MSNEVYADIEYLRELFDEEDGQLFWNERPVEWFYDEGFCKAWNTRFAGVEAGSPETNDKGVTRWRVGINGVLYFRYQIVYALHTEGLWVANLDHINRNTTDDKFENLRLATGQQNAANRGLSSNSSSGYKGVSWHSRDNIWQARIGVGNQRIHLGTFDTPEEAYAAYCEAAKYYHGEFACFG